MSKHHHDGLVYAIVLIHRKSVPEVSVKFDSHSLWPILISVLKLGSNVTKGVSQTKWYQ